MKSKIHIILAIFFTFTISKNSLIAATKITIQPTNQTICGNQTIKLITANSYAKSDISSINWQVKRNKNWVNLINNSVYSNVNSDTLVIINAPDSISNFEFQIKIILKTSVKDSSNSAKVIINSIPAKPTTSNNNISYCKNSTATKLSATATTGNNLLWYSTKGGTSSSTAPTPNTSIVGNLNFYCTQINPNTNCESDYLTYTITINDTPSIPTTAFKKNSYCQLQTTNQLTANQSSNCTIYWYNTLNATTGSTTAPTPSSNTAGIFKYYFGQKNSVTSCESGRDSITVTIDALPKITMQPSAATVCEGSNSTFSINATGTNITYQWQLDTTGKGLFFDITSSGSNPLFVDYTKSKIYVNNIPSKANNYQFRCIVKGKCNPNDTSTIVKLTVNTSPKIITNTTNNIYVCEQSDASLELTATGTALTYQWQINSGSGFNNITTAGSSPKYQNFNSSKLDIIGAQTSINGYQYRCMISGACTPAITSNSTVVSINTLPKITKEPSDIITCEGSNKTFEITAQGSGITYLWQYDNGYGWIDITTNGSSPYFTNFTKEKLNLTNITAINSGMNFRCIVNGTCTPSAISKTVSLIVDSKPTITNQPLSQNICKFQNTYSEIQCYGSRLSYQWQIWDSVKWIATDSLSRYSNYKNSKTNKIEVSSILKSEKLRCKISNIGCGELVSNAAILTVFTLPVIDIGKDTSICIGKSISITANTSKNMKSIQWSPTFGLSSYNSKNVTLTAITTTTYTATVIDSNNCTNSSFLTIKTLNRPNFFTNKTTSSICENDTDKLFIQTNDIISWIPNKNIFKSNGNNFLINPINSTSYKFKISTVYGCEDSFNYTVNVNKLPIIDAGVSKSICLNESIYLTPTGGLYYSWKPDESITQTNSSNPLVKPMKTTTYFVDGYSKEGCKNRDSVKITLNLLPIAKLISDSIVCANENLQLVAYNDNYKFIWEYSNNLNSLNTFNPIFNSQQSEKLVFTVIDKNGCKSNKSTLITVNALPKIQLTNKNIDICEGNIVKLSASGGSFYNWFLNNTLIKSNVNTIELKPLTTSIVKLTGSNTTNKCINIDSSVINIFKTPTPKIHGDSFICKNQNWVLYKSDNKTNNSKWEVTGGLIRGGDVANQIYIDWGSNDSGKISLLETNSNYPYCSATATKTVVLKRGKSENPTEIIAKGDNISSGILIAKNSNYNYYQWGTENKNTNQNTLSCKNKTWCYFNKIDTNNFTYYVLTGSDSICANKTYYNSIKIVSLDQNNDKPIIEIFPNPVNKSKLFVNIKSNDYFQTYNYSIYDMNGRIVVSENNSNIINIQNVFDGYYIVNIKTLDNKTINLPLVVLRD